MSKKILVISQYYYPEPFKVNKLCEDLVKEGNEVTVLTGLPNYNLEDIPDKYKNGKNRREIINGVEVVRVKEIARKKGVLRLLLNYISFCIFASHKILKLKKDFDCIFIYQLSPILMALPGILYKKLYKKPLYLYCLDLWPESVKNHVKNENNSMYKGIKKLSTYIYKNSDKIGITSKSFFEYFQIEHQISKDKIIYIPQSGEDKYLKEDLISIDNGVIDFVFMGNIGISQGIDNIIKAIESIKSLKNYKVHFIGNGSYLEKAKEIVKEKDLENVILFHGYHSIEKMVNFYKIADICLISLKGGNYISKTLPLKLQGYMAAGKPVLGSIDGDAFEIIRDSNCGLCVKADDWEGLAKLLKESIENLENIKALGINGKKYYKENFTSKKQLEGIISLIS